jgi:uncharacterized protein (DUF433 family)
MMWPDCPVVETIPGKVSGMPLVKGTRVPAQTIIDNFNAGVSEVDIAEQFDVTLAAVRAVIAFGRDGDEPDIARSRRSEGAGQLPGVV